MKSSDIAQIEHELDVTLPTDVREFLSMVRDEFDPDDVSIMDDPEGIIEMTKEYRSGYVGLPPWPKNWVYLGDESDACPYYINCDTGRIARLHKGDLRQEPLDDYETFAVYREKTRNDMKISSEAAKVPSTWKDTVRSYIIVAIVLLACFVILPVCLFGISLLFKWLFK